MTAASARHHSSILHRNVLGLIRKRMVLGVGSFDEILKPLF